MSNTIITQLVTNNNQEDHLKGYFGNISQYNVARFAGFLYLLLAIFAGFGFFVRQTMVVQGDANTTVSNIRASESLFRLSLVSDLVGQIIFLILGLALYVLLKPVNKNYAKVMLLFVTVSVPMAMLNMVNQFVVLLLLSDASYLSSFNSEQINGLVMLFLDIHTYGVQIVQLFWGLWLFPLGYLVFKSGYFPRILGILLMIGCFGYLIDSFVSFFVPSLSAFVEPIVTTPSAIAEISFVFWLMIKGANLPEIKP